MPWGLHERLWPIKYVIFLVLFGLSLYSLGTGRAAVRGGAVQDRDHPAASCAAGRSSLFAVALLAASLFIERFFCRYLCPLGAALAIPARLRMFDWLRRYRNAAARASAAPTNARCSASTRKGTSTPTSASTACTARCSTHHDQKCPHDDPDAPEARETHALSSPRCRVPARPRARENRRPRDASADGPTRHTAPTDSLRSTKRGETMMTKPDNRRPGLLADATCSAAPRLRRGRPGRRRRRSRRSSAGARRQHGRGRRRPASGRPTETEVQPGELDEYYVLLHQRPDRRGPHHRAAVDARADAHPGLQPLQRHRLGPDQREPQDPDRRAAARDRGVPGARAAASTTTATCTTRTCRSPTAPMTAAISSSTTRPTAASPASAST